MQLASNPPREALIRLTAKGIDLMEGTIEDDGVALYAPGSLNGTRLKVFTLKGSCKFSRFTHFYASFYNYVTYSAFCPLDASVCLSPFIFALSAGATLQQTNSLFPPGSGLRPLRRLTSFGVMPPACTILVK